MLEQELMSINKIDGAFLKKMFVSINSYQLVYTKL
jgi:hypothetical protein